MVKAGLTLMENAGVNHVFVLGDPAYYGRFGFEPDDGVMPPYQLPDEWRGAWQSLSLNQNKISLLGKLVVTKPWRQKTLWIS
jgi:putative acetyltransferase